MPDYYVSLVKEYLELQGYIVRTETKYPIKKKDKRGIFRTSWGDIDIIAVKVSEDKVTDSIVGEVKGESKTEKGIKQISAEQFENPHLKKKIVELLGSENYKKHLYCWSCEPKAREYAEKIGIVPVAFEEIIDYMRGIIEKKLGWYYEKDSPNLMLLQYLYNRSLSANCRIRGRGE